MNLSLATMFPLAVRAWTGFNSSTSSVRATNARAMTSRCFASHKDLADDVNRDVLDGETVIAIGAWGMESRNCSAFSANHAKGTRRKNTEASAGNICPRRCRPLLATD